MKKSLVLMLVVGLVVALSGVASAHIGTDIFPLYELPTADLPDLRDSTLEDWEDVLPGTSLDHNSFAPLNVADGAGICQIKFGEGATPHTRIGIRTYSALPSALSRTMVGEAPSANKTCATSPSTCCAISSKYFELKPISSPSLP